MGISERDRARIKEMYERLHEETIERLSSFPPVDTAIEKIDLEKLNSAQFYSLGLRLIHMEGASAREIVFGVGLLSQAFEARPTNGLYRWTLEHEAEAPRVIEAIQKIRAQRQEPPFFKEGVWLDFAAIRRQRQENKNKDNKKPKRRKGHFRKRGRIIWQT